MWVLEIQTHNFVLAEQVLTKPAFQPPPLLSLFWRQSHFVSQAGLELGHLAVYCSRVLGSQGYLTTFPSAGVTGMHYMPGLVSLLEEYF